MDNLCSFLEENRGVLLVLNKISDVNLSLFFRGTRKVLFVQKYLSPFKKQKPDKFLSQVIPLIFVTG